jgi:hypothetical protein
MTRNVFEDLLLSFHIADFGLWRRDILNGVFQRGPLWSFGK